MQTGKIDRFFPPVHFILTHYDQAFLACGFLLLGIVTSNQIPVSCNSMKGFAWKVSLDPLSECVSVYFSPSLPLSLFLTLSPCLPLPPRLANYFQIV